MITLLEFFLERAQLFEFSEFILNILYDLPVLSILIEVGDFFILFLLTDQISVDKDFFTYDLLKFMIHLYEVICCLEFKNIVSLMGANKNSSEISWLFYHNITTL